jgi:hypothetical protein
MSVLAIGRGQESHQGAKVREGHEGKLGLSGPQHFHTHPNF